MIRVGAMYVAVIATVLAVDCLAAADFDARSVPLVNGAKSGVRMPIVGIGTGGYGPPGETWDDSVAERAVTEFLRLGGRRIDTSLSYDDQQGIACTVKASQLPRENIFITSKVGGGPLGYKATLQQAEDILEQFGFPYVDLLLVHWPGPGNTSDPECNKGSTDSEKATSCRQATWRAMETILQSGKALAIGVSNFEQNHLQDIIDMNSTLPAVNQVEFQPYWQEYNLVHFCQLHNITFNGYAPLGAPDWAPYTPTAGRDIIQQ